MFDFLGLWCYIGHRINNTQTPVKEESDMTINWKLAGVTAFAFVIAAVALPAATADSNDGSVPRNPTFTKDILPILQKSCQECHRPGTMAPMSLLTYEQTRPWARSIREKVATRYMPPWH